MTLNLFIVSPWGTWLSTDFRVSDISRRGVVTPRADFWSAKHATFTTSNARLVLTYAGAAEVTAVEPDLGLPPDMFPRADFRPGKRQTVAVSEWLTWIAHGRTRTLDELLQHIASEATQNRQLTRLHHVFSGVAFASDGAWLIQISNIDHRPGENARLLEWTRRPPFPSFRVSGALNVNSKNEAMGGAVGSGTGSLTDDEYRLMHRLSQHKPRNASEYANALGNINRRVAERDPTRSVSPACVVLHMEAEPTHGRAQIESFLRDNGQTPPSDFYSWDISNYLGIDFTGISRNFVRSAEAQRLALESERGPTEPSTPLGARPPRNQDE